jgi:hypothetical protein
MRLAFAAFFATAFLVAGLFAVPVQATPTSGPPLAASAAPKAPPCKELAGAVARCKVPDLTAGPSITVGGHTTTWSGNLTLTDADALPAFRPYCAFDLAYVLRNVGLGNAGPPNTPAFRNEINLDVMPGGVFIVSTQSLLSLAASTNQTMKTQVELPSGSHTLILHIDQGNAVVESDEFNNLFAVTYQLTGNCKNPSQ